MVGGQLVSVLQAVVKRLNFSMQTRTTPHNETSCVAADPGGGHREPGLHGVDPQHGSGQRSAVRLALAGGVLGVVRAHGGGAPRQPRRPVRRPLDLHLALRGGGGLLGGGGAAGAAAPRRPRAGLRRGLAGVRPAPAAVRRPPSGPRLRSTAIRTFLVHWGVFAVVLVAVFEATVKSGSVQLRRQPQLVNIRDLARSHLALLGSYSVVDFLRRSAGKDPDPVHSQLARRIRTCDGDLHNSLTRVAERRDAAVLTFDFRCKNYNLAAGEARLHILRSQCLRSSQLNLFSGRHWSPHMDRVSAISRRLVEAGLIQRALAAPAHRPRLHSDTPVFMKVRPSHVALHLIVLSLGMVIASLVFAAELTFTRVLARDPALWPDQQPGQGQGRPARNT